MLACDLARRNFCSSSVAMQPVVGVAVQLHMDGEICIGSWAAGRGQSKPLAALPVWLMEGDDSAENLRSRVQPVATQFNTLKKKGTLPISVNGTTRQVKTKLLCAADFQFFKAAMNMSKYTSAVWCCCPLEKLYVAPERRAESWADVESFYNSLGCRIKDLETICELNHYSWHVLEGRAFEPFSCRCGYHSGSEHQWRAACEAHAQLDEAARKAADLEHSGNPLHCRHEPFEAPLFHQGAMDNSCDVLHLVFINLFTTFLELTMLIYLDEYDEDARRPFEEYLRSISVPMKIVKATNVTEMKQSLCGRDAKVLLQNAIKHIPHLLEYVSYSKSEVEGALQGQLGQEQSAQEAEQRGPRIDQDDVFDWEGEEGEVEEQPSSEEVDDDSLTRSERDARSWDKFLLLVHAMRPFTQDDVEYRRAHAVETFNAAADVMREYKRLNPSTRSACPHVALCVLPRQQVSNNAWL